MSVSSTNKVLSLLSKTSLLGNILKSGNVPAKSKEEQVYEPEKMNQIIPKDATEQKLNPTEKPQSSSKSDKTYDKNNIEKLIMDLRHQLEALNKLNNK